MVRLFMWLPLILVAVAVPAVAQTIAAHEPIEIGTTPQLLLDGYIVDNTWALRHKVQPLRRPTCRYCWLPWLSPKGAMPISRRRREVCACAAWKTPSTASWSRPSNPAGCSFNPLKKHSGSKCPGQGTDHGKLKSCPYLLR